MAAASSDPARAAIQRRESAFHRRLAEVERRAVLARLGLDLGDLAGDRVVRNQSRLEQPVDEEIEADLVARRIQRLLHRGRSAQGDRRAD